MDTLQEVKVLTGTKEDNLQDDVIAILIKNAESRLKIWLKKHAGLDAIPSELQFIITEMVVARFNRLGSEGMKSDSVEGHAITFNEDDFAAYTDVLNSYKKNDSSTGRGKVLFI
ncbi:phage head-tail adapter protein [Virgibacillus halodenitrificans]|nr:phage head-tail adapter protein [Virgibacillus halodenitrificans]